MTRGVMMAAALCALLTALPSSRALASASARSNKVVLILADYLSLADLTNRATPGIVRLAREGSVGLLTPSAVSARNPEASYASASAGSNCWGSGAVDSAFNISEVLKTDLGNASEVFERRTGTAASGSVVLPELFQLRKDNEAKGATSLPGALGDELAKAGKRCAVLGNSDPARDDYRRRAAVVAAMSDGSVDAPADVEWGRLFVQDSFSVSGETLDPQQLAKAVQQSFEGGADFVVVDFGDTTRVELNRYKMSQRAYDAHRKKALANLDGFISRILTDTQGSTTILLASMVSRPGPNGERLELGPVVVRQAGGGPGRLISATTRTPGLVAAADFAPTVLRAFGIGAPKGMVGAPIKTAPGEIGQVARLSDLVVMDRRIIIPVLAVLGGIGIAVVTLACLALAFGRAEAVGGLVRVFFGIVASSPVSVLFATQGEASAWPFVVRLALWMVGLTAAAFLLASLIRRIIPGAVRRLPGALPIILLMVVTSTVLFVDAMTGGEYSRFTVISAGRFDGYRFYGIGNEYMGVWLGMAMVSLIWIRECFPAWLTRYWGKAAILTVCLAIVVALGMPRFGANYGGAVAAVVGLGLVYKSGTAGRFRWYDVVGLLAAAFVLVLLTGIADMTLSKGSPTHIGRAASLSGSGWYLYLPAMAVRKIAMNMALIGTDQARYAIMASVPFFVLWFWKIGKMFDRMTEGRPELRWGCAAVLVGAAAAFIFNDSGIVAWGLMAGYLAHVVAYTLVERETARCTE